MISGRNLVCLAAADWNDNPVSVQHLMSRFAKENQVVFVETIGNRFPGIRDIPRVLRRLKRTMRGPSARPTSLAATEVSLFSPVAIPYHESEFIERINERLVRGQLRRLRSRITMDAPLVWVSSPLYLRIVDALAPALVVYHVVDKYSTYVPPHRVDKFESLERSMMERADVVLVAPRAIFDERGGEQAGMVHMPNGTDLDVMEKVRDPATPRAPELVDVRSPVIGYVGTMASWTDFDLLGHIARSRPDWTLVCVGYAHAQTDPRKIEELDRLPNVRFTGQVPYLRLPEFYRAFDACIVPYVLNDHIRYSNPVKIYEYLASGRPVVSTDFPAARDFEHLIGVARTHEEFLRMLDGALRDPGDERARLDEASRHTWSARIEAISTILTDALERHGRRGSGGGARS